jgi:hypothetical protein
MEKKVPVLKAQEKEQKTPGPEPELLKIDMGWEEAIKRSLEKKKPIGGWSK